MRTRTTAAALAGLALLAGLAFPAGPGLADEPGPGGTKPPVPKTGAEVYSTYCQACHMAGGRGAAGAGSFPALAANPRLASPEYLIYMVEHGKGGMPSFSRELSPAQAAALATYLRTHFGNSYPEPVTAARVEAVRRQLSD
jgi:mono/diheme cytochrome c family protein